MAELAEELTGGLSFIFGFVLLVLAIDKLSKTSQIDASVLLSAILPPLAILLLSSSVIYLASRK